MSFWETRGGYSWWNCWKTLGGILRELLHTFPGNSWRNICGIHLRVPGNSCLKSWGILKFFFFVKLPEIFGKVPKEFPRKILKVSMHNCWWFLEYILEEYPVYCWSKFRGNPGGIADNNGGISREIIENFPGKSRRYTTTNDGAILRELVTELLGKVWRGSRGIPEEIFGNSWRNSWNTSGGISEETLEKYPGLS